MLLPTSVLDVKGLATYEVFLRGAFDKFGVTPDFIHIGDYKTAVNTFTEKTFTPAHREMTAVAEPRRLRAAGAGDRDRPQEDARGGAQR